MNSIARIALILVVAFSASPVVAQTLKISTVLPEGSDWMTAFRAGSAEVAERTEGRVEIKFYGSGVQGIGPQLLRKIRVGQLHGGTFTAGEMAVMQKDVQVMTLPMVFEDLDEVAYVRSRLEPELRRRLEEAGWVNFGFLTSGFAYLLSKQPVQTPEDLNGMRIWIPEGDQVAYEGVRALGGAPVPLPLTDALTGLETDLIDSVSASPAAAVILQWHTRVRYITQLPLQLLYGSMAIDARAFGRLSEDDQAIVRDVFERVWRELDENSGPENEEAMAALTAIGVESVTPPADQVPDWFTRVRQTNERLIADGLVDADIWADFNRYLEEFRSGQTADVSP